MPPASDPLLVAISDRLDTIEQRLTALETATSPATPAAQPDKHGKTLGMAMGIALLLFIVAAGVIGLIALWEAVV